ncbi:Fpg/Nei family DNA glycosylase [Candidatus Poriferisocius sp.]|uniref:Fpg/Nei family DNA glycosylase n=1 Tax=Candidatus Poriferisocius sp. TaxID=3101276 RepID=UPI003B52D75D
MPELPDVVVYLEALDRFVVGRKLRKIRVIGVSLLQTFDPPISAAEGRAVVGTRRLGKRLVLELDGPDELYLVVHLMVAGRLRWRDQPGAKPPGKIGLAAFDFEQGTLLLTEASKRKRASLWLVNGGDALAEGHDRGGVEPLETDEAAFRDALNTRNRTLKRALCDPTVFSGIGNAYSDEILFHAGLSPVQRTGHLSDTEIARLYQATRSTLLDWTDRHRQAVGAGFPDKVTAFHDDMAVHGKYNQPCLVCAVPVQRIVYVENEVNYCPQCQTGGRVLADRSLSRLLKDDWPRSIEDLED